MNIKSIPKELLPIAGRLLRQARLCRQLTPAQAAVRIGISVEQLEGLEQGNVPTTTEHVQFLVARYGGARGGAADDFIVQLMMEKSRCRLQTEKRKHLSALRGSCVDMTLSANAFY